MITIVMPVSRTDYLPRVFAQLELMECDRETTNLLTYVDGPLEMFQDVRNRTQNSKFAQKLCVYRKRGAPSVGGVYRRRQRIADIHNEIKQYLTPSQLLLLTEDDTLMPINAVTKLLAMDPGGRNTGIVSGVELGRWGYRHIGAWRVKDPYDFNEIISTPPAEGVEKVDATGFYCCMLRTDLYLKHAFQPYDKALGPDFNLGIQFRREGYTNFIDNSIKCIHLTKKETIDFKDGKIDQVVLREQTNGQWSIGRYDGQ